MPDRRFLDRIVTNNGPKPISRSAERQLARHAIELESLGPIGPVERGFVESHNATLREGRINSTMSEGREDARRRLETLRMKYGREL